MGRRHYRSGRRSSRYSTDAGREAARRHIEEARQFSEEIGGTDQDVKQYFFGLPARDLETVLCEYGQRFGRDAEQYARDIFPLWKTGARRMSGRVAKRLFGLLPEFMPLAKKYELAGNVWHHFGPSSRHSFIVGETADVSEIEARLVAKLEDVVLHYNVPENVQNRFTWLAAGDVRVKEQLLNYFRQAEKQLLLEKLKLELPVLQRHMQSNPRTMHQARQSLAINKHQFDIWVENGSGNTVREGQPHRAASAGSSLWIWVLIAAGIFLFFMLSR